MSDSVRRGKPFWRGKIHEIVYIRTFSGREEEILFIYVLRRNTREDEVVRVMCRWDKSYKALGLSLGAVDKLKKDVLRDCRRLRSATEKKKKDKEDLAQFRKARAEQKSRRREKLPKDQLKLI